jgi:hypothetical protein
MFVSQGVSWNAMPVPIDRFACARVVVCQFLSREVSCRLYAGWLAVVR